MKSMKMLVVGLLFPWLGMAQQPVASGELETYPAPQGVELKSDFAVRVRIPGGEWQPVATYAVNHRRACGECDVRMPMTKL